MMIFLNETSRRLIGELDKVEANKEPFEAKSYLGKFSMDTIASCAFGVDAKVYSEEKSIFVEYANKIFQQDYRAILKFLLIMIPFIGPYILRFFQLSFTPKKEIEFFYDIVLKTLQQRKLSKGGRNDLIDMMVDAVKGELEEGDHEED